MDQRSVVMLGAGLFGLVALAARLLRRRLGRARPRPAKPGRACRFRAALGERALQRPRRHARRCGAGRSGAGRGDRAAAGAAGRAHGARPHHARAGRGRVAGAGRAVVYLILEILWFLVAAAAIGFAVGWLCRSAALLRRRESAAMQTRAAHGEFEGQREQLEARLAEAASARNTLQEEIAQARAGGRGRCQGRGASWSASTARR